MPARPSPRILVSHAAVAAALLCSACGGTDASKEVETLRSWRATIDLAADARLHGWVTPRYADQLRDAAGKAVTAGDRAMAGATPAERDTLRDAGRDLRLSLVRLDRVGP
jgi:hypothetical protein